MNNNALDGLRCAFLASDISMLIDPEQLALTNYIE